MDIFNSIRYSRHHVPVDYLICTPSMVVDGSQHPSSLRVWHRVRGLGGMIMALDSFDFKMIGPFYILEVPSWMHLSTRVNTGDALWVSPLLDTVATGRMLRNVTAFFKMMKKSSYTAVSALPFPILMDSDGKIVQRTDGQDSVLPGWAAIDNNAVDAVIKPKGGRK